jgi:hypothetical protein
LSSFEGKQLASENLEDYHQDQEWGSQPQSKVVKDAGQEAAGKADKSKDGGIDKIKLMSKREAAMEAHQLLHERLTEAREDIRTRNINATLLAHAHKSQESHAAQRVIGEIGKTLVKLGQLAEILQREKKTGWQAQLERTLHEIDFLTRDQARREKIVAKAGAETRKDMMNVLYQRSLVLRPENVVRPQAEPPGDFLEDMDIIYGPADAEMDENTPEEEGFPPAGSREDFIYDPRQVVNAMQNKRGKKRRYLR